jgi:hypothetical protein
MNGEREYRVNPVIGIAGIIFFLEGMFFQVKLLASYAIGEPPPIRVNGREIVDPPLIVHIGILIFPLIFWVAGVVLFLYWFKRRVYLSEDAIRATNLFGNTVFYHQWSEIVDVNRGYYKGTTLYTLRTNTQKLTLSDSDPRFSEIKEVLEQRLGKLMPQSPGPRKLSVQAKLLLSLAMVALTLVYIAIFLFFTGKR